MGSRSKIALISGIILLVVFFIIKTLVLSKVIDSDGDILIFEIFCILSFIPIFYVTHQELIKKTKLIETSKEYSSKLNDLLVEQSNNDLYYEGNLLEAAKVLSKAVAQTLNVDRVSVWLLDDGKSALDLQLLYLKESDVYETMGTLRRSSHRPYFNYLFNQSVIVVNDVHKHTATTSLSKVYTKPYGIKSKLDIPIWYNGDVVGVIFIESLSTRDWNKEEIDFAQILTSLYSCAYTVRMNKIVSKDLYEFEKFIDRSLLVSKADVNGNITYVNKKFEEVSGWKSKEIIGKHYRTLSSGAHTKEFWDKMIKTVVVDKKMWTNMITNKNKNGELYWVDAYIKGEFDSETGELEGFICIWYNITDMVKGIQEIEKKNTYLEYASKIIRHDMHSGINTYIPKGVSSLERRLSEDIIKKYKLENPLKLIKEGLKHTQKVYKGVYDFTNLVKKDVELDKVLVDTGKVLRDYLLTTAYADQVLIGELPNIMVNESLFCTAVDNLIRNSLKYNDSETKVVKVFMDDENTLAIQDNGRGMSQDDFNNLSIPYKRKNGQKESGSGLGLNICTAILNEHGFKISCENPKEGGTKIKIKIK